MERIVEEGARRKGGIGRWRWKKVLSHSARTHTHTHTNVLHLFSTWMWPLSKCTRCYVTTCLLWTPVGVRVVDDEIPGGGRGRGVTAFAGCVPWWMGMMVSGTNRSAKCLLVIAAIFRNVHRAQIFHTGRPFVTSLLKLRFEDSNEIFSSEWWWWISFLFTIS